MTPDCEFCGHPFSEHRPACECRLMPYTDAPAVVRVCGCLFYVPPERTDLADAYDAPGIPHAFGLVDTWRTGRPWWSS